MVHLGQRHRDLLVWLIPLAAIDDPRSPRCSRTPVPGNPVEDGELGLGGVIEPEDVVEDRDRLRGGRPCRVAANLNLAEAFEKSGQALETRKLVRSRHGHSQLDGQARRPFAESGKGAP